MTDEELIARLRASRAVWEDAKSRPTDDETAAADRIEALEANLKEAVRGLQIARVHVANNECGWSVGRAAARFDLGVIDHIMEKIGASYD